MTTQNPSQGKKISAEGEAVRQKKKSEVKQKKSPDKMSEIDEHISRRILTYWEEFNAVLQRCLQAEDIWSMKIVSSLSISLLYKHEEKVETSLRPTRFEIKKRLGKGAYGIVWKAIDKKTKEVVAVKKIFDAFRNQTDAQRTFREIIFLQSFRNHPNIIKLHSIHRAHNNRDIYLGFEFMDTDLHNVIKRGNILKDIHKRYIMYQMLRATKYIHSGNVIHRDQKPSNVLIDSSCRVKLADFGLARSVSGLSAGSASGVDGAGDACLTDYVATRWYRAPEILVASKRYTKGIDMWSLGCILGEMLTGKALFPGSSTVNQLERIMAAIPAPSKEDINSVCTGYGSALITNNSHTSEGGNNSFPSLSGMLSSGAPDAVDLVRKLLIFNPQKRLSAVQALKHDYVAKFHREKDEPSLKYDVIPPLNDDLQLSVDDYRNKLYSLMDRGGAGGGVASAPVRSHKQRAILPQKSHKLKLSEGNGPAGGRRHSLGSLPLSQGALSLAAVAHQPQIAPAPAPTPQTSTPPQQYHPVNYTTGGAVPVTVCSSVPLPAAPRAIRGSGATYFHSQSISNTFAPQTVKARVTRTSKLEKSVAMSHLQPMMQLNHSRQHGDHTTNGNPRIVRSDVKITNGEQRYKNDLNIDCTVGRKEFPSKGTNDQRMDRLDRFGDGRGEWYGSYYQQCNTKCQGDFKVPSQSHHRRDENIRDAMRDRPISTLPYRNNYDQSDSSMYDKFGRKSSVVISNAIVNVNSGIR